MSAYDKWRTEGDTHKCRDCGDEYTDADRECPRCADWRSDLMDKAIAKLEAMTIEELDEFAQGGN